MIKYLLLALLSIAKSNDTTEASCKSIQNYDREYPCEMDFFIDGYHHVVGVYYNQTASSFMMHYSTIEARLFVVSSVIRAFDFFTSNKYKVINIGNAGHFRANDFYICLNSKLGIRKTPDECLTDDEKIPKDMKGLVIDDLTIYSSTADIYPYDVFSVNCFAEYYEVESDYSPLKDYTKIFCDGNIMSLL